MQFMVSKSCLQFMVSGSLTGVDLVVDVAFTLLDLEGSLVSPGVVPGVHGKPVVLATFGSPANEFDSVTTEFASTLVRVHSALVREEVFVYGEGCSDSSVLVDVLFD